MRTYENCFTGAEAIEWLHKHLKKNPNFDGEVTKEQAVRLLQKLLKAAVIEPVHQSMGSIMSTRFVNEYFKKLSKAHVTHNMFANNIEIKRHFDTKILRSIFFF